MAKRLPPAGSGYSGRSAASGRYVSKSAMRKGAAGTSRSSAPNRVGGATPPKGSGGVTRAK